MQLKKTLQKVSELKIEKKKKRYSADGRLLSWSLDACGLVS